MLIAICKLYIAICNLSREIVTSRIILKILALHGVIRKSAAEMGNFLLAVQTQRSNTPPQRTSHSDAQRRTQSWILAPKTSLRATNQELSEPFTPGCGGSGGRFPIVGTSYRDGCAPGPSRERHSSCENSGGEFRRAGLPFQIARCVRRAFRCPVRRCRFRTSTNRLHRQNQTNVSVSNGLLASEQDQSLDDVAEFADVAGPGIAAKFGDRRLWRRVFLSSRFAWRPGGRSVRRECGKIFEAFAQRG